jgi:hypothetical protein
MQKVKSKINTIKRILKLVLSSFSLLFVGWLVFIVVYDVMTGATSIQHRNTVLNMNY